MTSDRTPLLQRLRPKILGALQTVSRHRLALGAFLLPLLLRTIPEILVGPYPIGWDVIAYYIPNSLDIASGNMSVWGLISSPPVMYAIVVPIYVLTKINLILIFKILGPVLYGFLGYSIFRFCQIKLHWSARKAFYAVLFVSAYFVTMRIGWDAYQTELGIGLFLLAQSITQTGTSLRPTLVNTSLMSLAVLSNQIAAVLVVATQLLGLLQSSNWRKARNAVLGFAPIVLFLLIVYSMMQLPIASEFQFLGYGYNVTNIFSVGSFFVYGYALLIPLVLFGIGSREKSIFATWVAVCVLGAIMSTLPGQVFQDIGYRWVLLIAIPLLIIAYEGYTRLESSARHLSRKWPMLLKGTLIATLAISAALFTVLPAQSAFPPFTMFPQYAPTSMIQSSLPLSDYPNVVSAMHWVNTHLGENSVVITHMAFYGWARVYLSPGTEIVNSLLSSPTTSLGHVGSFSHVYTIWWSQESGWFKDSYPYGAKPVITFGDLAVYQYR